MTEPTKPILCAYKSLGRAPHDAATIVFVHSLGADHGMWQPQLEALAANYHLLALDIRGHGQAQVPQGLDQPLEFSAGLERFVSVH
ncbi:MAG: 3-oxoadipate enol-lactonase [Pseudomonadota bacterium]|jgi:pimeloyl-ACP methyl ester carboxylesterase